MCTNCTRKEGKGKFKPKNSSFRNFRTNDGFSSNQRYFILVYVGAMNGTCDMCDVINLLIYSLLLLLLGATVSTYKSIIWVQN